MTTAMVSPIALPTPSITAASIPDFAAGKITEAAYLYYKFIFDDQHSGNLE